METLPADTTIPLDSPTFRAAMQRYQANLRRLIDLVRRADIPLVISTVPSNLRDMAPLQPPRNQRVVQELQAAANHVSYREYDAALSILTKAITRTPTSAHLTYRLGQCLEELGRAPEATEMYQLAADLDGCRLRAARPLSQIVRQVAEEVEGVVFCDVADELQQRSKLAAPGSDFFLEHVHYNLEGNWQVASILAEAVLSDVLNEGWSGERVPNATARDKLLDITPLDYLAADSLTMIVFEAWPFNLLPERSFETNALRARMKKTYRMVDSIDQEAFANLSMSAMEQNLWLAMGSEFLKVGENDRSQLAFERHVRRRPADPAGQTGVAMALRAKGMFSGGSERSNQHSDRELEEAIP